MWRFLYLWGTLHEFLRDSNEFTYVCTPCKYDPWVYGDQVGPVVVDPVCLLHMSPTECLKGGFVAYLLVYSFKLEKTFLNFSRKNGGGGFQSTLIYEYLVWFQWKALKWFQEFHNVIPLHWKRVVLIPNAYCHWCILKSSCAHLNYLWITGMVFFGNHRKFAYARQKNL